MISGPEDVPPLEDADGLPGFGQIRGCHQSVVPAADDEAVETLLRRASFRGAVIHAAKYAENGRGRRWEMWGASDGVR